MALEFRKLRADEIDIRVAQISEKGASLLLYKDARCDMNILDETVGPMGWMRQHSRENANCTVSLWDKDKQMWISKEDTGTESNTEAEKGLASDSFKRACFNWGIGRELYTAPFIWVPSGKVNISDKQDKYGKIHKVTYDKFTVKSIDYDGNVISSLEIINDNGETVYTFAKGNLTCADCGKKIKGVTTPSGTEYTAQSIAENTRNKYKRCLCWDCSVKAKGSAA